MQEISDIRRARIKPFLNSQYAQMCELEFEHSKYLFGEDIAKNINKAKEMAKLKKNFTKEYYKTNNSNASYNYSNSNYSNNRNRNNKSFLYKGRNTQHGPPRFKRR